MNGNVGIGTWVPARKLVVTGTNDSDSIRITNAAGSDSIGWGYNDEGSGNNGGSLYSQQQGQATFTVWNNGETMIGRSYVNNDSQNTNPDGLIVQGNVGIGTLKPAGALVVMNGNVGIGTWVPAQALTVANTSYFQGGIAPRIYTMTESSHAVTPNSGISDIDFIDDTDAASTGLTINADAGSPVRGQKMIVEIQTTNVQNYTWNGVYTNGTYISCPASSSGSGAIDYVGLIYDTINSHWHCIAVSQGYS